MTVLLKQTLIVDPSSPYHLTVKDILITDGVVCKIDTVINTQDNIPVINKQGLVVSPGWVDTFAHFSDPGSEHKETLETGAVTATAGGFTRVFSLPNTQPVVHNKTSVEYIVQKSKQLPVTIHPIGAVTKNAEGKDLAEMYDMYNSGAIAFSDGVNPIQSSGVMLKALQYVKAFNGVIIQQPIDQSIAKYGLIHEGITSTQLGLPGIPAIAEKMLIQRDIELLQYTDSRLHISGVSTAAGIALIEEAKNVGMKITCSVTPYHLTFFDEDLVTYDTNLKVNPPLRSREDRDALRNAVKNGIVDCIASHHIPQDWDNKTCEFEYAKSGMIGLQTAYVAVQTAIPDLTPEKTVQLFSLNARRIFNLPPASIKENAPAEVTLFSPSGTTILTKENNQSKSSNSPFFGKILNGEVLPLNILCSTTN